MNIPGEEVLTTSWHRVRDAGSAVGELASETLANSSLARSLPKVKDFMATGAGLAIARRSAKIALTTVRRNPVIAIAGAVALAGAGAVYLAAKKRKAAAEAANGDGAAPKRLSAGTRRQSAGTGTERTRARATRQRKARPNGE
jgi:hypothetical protein